MGFFCKKNYTCRYIKPYFSFNSAKEIDSLISNFFDIFPCNVKTLGSGNFILCSSMGFSGKYTSYAIKERSSPPFSIVIGLLAC